MAAITKIDSDQFRVRFGELARTRRGEPVQIDPFLVAQAIGHVMRACAIRSATGRPIVWNHYRMILARADHELIRPLQGPLERDLRTVITEHANARDAELVGELRVTVVFDEADELPRGEGVVRVAFVPTFTSAPARPGELTMRFDSRAIAGEVGGRGRAPATDTVIVGDAAPACSLRWAGGEAMLSHGVTRIAGRPHPDPPPQFIALNGAGAKVNKQQFWISVSATAIRVGRFVTANPVHVNGRLVAAGEHVDVVAPIELSLSHGALVLTVSPT
ncbi:MAG: FhaA domain-containing protein [Kofleriaceae bacterium]